MGCGTMSRCFPYPLPGYEPRLRSEHKDLLKKERHKEKKHIKENGREKREREKERTGVKERENERIETIRNSKKRSAERGERTRTGIRTTIKLRDNKLRRLMILTIEGPKKERNMKQSKILNVQMSWLPSFQVKEVIQTTKSIVLVSCFLGALRALVLQLLKKRRVLSVKWLRNLDMQHNTIMVWFKRSPHSQGIAPYSSTELASTNTQEVDWHKLQSGYSNGIVGSHYLEQQKISVSSSVYDSNEGYVKPPHPDTKYLSQVQSIPSRDDIPECIDQDWLFSEDRVERKAETFEAAESHQV